MRRKRAAGELLAELVDLTEVTARFEGWLLDPDLDWRAEVIEFVGERGLTPFAPLLYDALEGTVEELCQAYAITAAGDLRSEANLPSPAETGLRPSPRPAVPQPVPTSATMSEPETYRDVIHRLYARRPKGEREEEVRLGETMLSRPFPRVLRDYYLFAGHTEPFNRTQDRLLAPSALFREAGALVFYEENQRVNLWGILDADLDRDDPPVHAAWNEEPLRWEPDHDRLSDFFTTMAYWQAANGALPNLALGRGHAGLPSLAGLHWPEVGRPGERWGLRIFSRDGQVVCVLLGSDGECQVHAAGRKPADLRSVRDLLPVEWDLVETEED